MPGLISEVTVRRQTGVQRKKQAKAARKWKRLRGSRRPKRLTGKQKAAVRKRKGTGFYKKIARLRSSLDLPATITGSISHRPEYIDAVLEAAAELDAEKQDARAFAKLFIDKDPAFSNTDTGMAAILFEAFVFEKGEDIVQQFLETQLEGPDTTFLAIFEGKIEDEALQKLTLGVRDICTIDPLVRAGDTNHEEGIISDVTILECTPKRQKKSKAATQPEPTLRTEGLLPQTKADYEAVLEEGGLSDNAFMYLYPAVWESAKGNNGDIRTATEPTGITWYCNEGIWLPDIESLVVEDDLDEAFKKGRKVKWTAPDGTKMSGSVVSDVGPNYDIKVRVTNPKPKKGEEEVLVKRSRLKEDLDEAQKFKTAEQVRDHFFDKAKGYKIKIAGHTLTVVAASVRGSPPTLRWTGKKKGKGFVLDFLNAVDPDGKKFPSGGRSESIQEAFTATFPDTTRANRFARECRTHARTIRPKGLNVYYEAREADHTEEETHQEAIDELCKKHGGKKRKSLKEEGDSHDIVAGPFSGDGEPRLIHNGHCEVLGFQAPLQEGPLYLENEEGFQSKFLSWTVRKEGTDDGKTLVNVGDSTYRLPVTLSEVKGLLDKMEEFYEDLPDEFDAMVQAYFEEYAEANGEALCHEDIVSLGLQEAQEEWSTHEFTTDRDARISAKCRLRRLALGEAGTTTLTEADIDDVRGGRAAFRGTRFMCNECGEHWRTRAGPTTFAMKCPKCGSYDTGPSEDVDTMSSVEEAKKYAIRTEKGAKKGVLQAIRKRDRTAKVDPEGNPTTAWVTTKLSVKALRAMDGVEDAVETTSIIGFGEASLGEAKPKGTRFKCQECGKLFRKRLGPRTFEVTCPKCKSTDVLPTEYFGEDDETCTVEVIQTTAWDTLGHKSVAENRLVIDDEDMGRIDEATLSTMVPYFQAAGLGDIRLEKATTKVVKCPECGGKVLKATGYCVTCKKKTIKEDDYEVDEQVMREKRLAEIMQSRGYTHAVIPKKGEGEPLYAKSMKLARLMLTEFPGGKIVPIEKLSKAKGESIDEAKVYFVVTALKPKGHKITPATTKDDAFKTAKKQGGKVVLATSAKDAVKRVKAGEYVMEDDLDEAKTFGLTLEKIRLSGEYQAFKVLKGKSLVGFLMQTGKNTATEEHPWKAFRVAQRGQVGEKIGFYYKKDGGKNAALQAIARTGLESEDIDEPIEEQLYMGGGVEIILPKGSKDYASLTKVEIDVDNKTAATATRAKDAKKWTLKFHRGSTSAEKKKAEKALADFHMKYVESIDEAKHYYTVAGALSREELQKKLGVTLVGYAKGALGKVGARLIQTKRPIKDAAAKAGLKVTKISKEKFMELAEDGIVVHVDNDGNVIEARNAPLDLVASVRELQRSLADADTTDDLDEALRVKRRNVEALRAFTVFVSTDSKAEAATFSKALKGTSFHRGGGLFFHKTPDAKNVEFTILGGMRDADEVLTVLRDITGTNIILENYEITQLEGAKLTEARANALTMQMKGVGKVTEPTHMRALAKRAGKSAKAALKLWGKAQAAANKQYPEFKAAKGKGGEKERRYYKVVTAIFKNMLGLGKAEAEQCGPIIAEVLCHSCRSTTEVFMWPWTEAVCGECQSVHITPTGELHYATEEECEAADPALLEAVSIGTPPDMMLNWHIMEAVIWTDGRNEANIVKKALGKHFGYYDPKKGMLGGLIKGGKVSTSGFKAQVVVNVMVTPDRFLGGLKDALGKTGLQLKGHAFEVKQCGIADND